MASLLYVSARCIFGEIQLRSQRPEEDGSKALKARAPNLLISPPTSLKVLIFRAYGQPRFPFGNAPRFRLTPETRDHVWLGIFYIPLSAKAYGVGLRRSALPLSSAGDNRLLSTFRPPTPKWHFFSVSPPETENKLTRRQPRPSLPVSEVSSSQGGYFMRVLPSTSSDSTSVPRWHWGSPFSLRLIRAVTMSTPAAPIKSLWRSI